MNRPGVGVTAAILIEKAQAVKDTVARIDQQAGPDDVLFRKLIKEYFRPDLKAEVKVGTRNRNIPDDYLPQNLNAHH